MKLSWRPYARWWSEPLDLRLLRFRTKYDRSLASVDGVVDSTTASHNRTASGHIWSCRDGPTRDDGLSRLIYVYYKPEQSRLVASICRWSGGQRYGQSKSDLIRTHMKLSWRPDERWWSEPLDLRLLQSQWKYDWSLAAVDGDVTSTRYDMAAQCGACGQP